MKLSFSAAVLQRSFPNKMLWKHETNPEKNKNVEAGSHQNLFGNLLKSHPCTDNSLKICSTSSDHPLPVKQLWGTASACQKNFKRLKL